MNKQNPKPHCRTKKGAKQWSTGRQKAVKLERHWRSMTHINHIL
jgi:hypothetical protein